MPSRTAPAVPNMHPPLGTLIDDDSLELVEVLGVGGYGVVYRAEETYMAQGHTPKSYAVKCLLRSHQSPRQRQVHIREVALHQLASAHPNVVSLYRVLEDYYHTYIIMEYAPDHDLFTQILHHARYLGDDGLIRHIFLQLLDAVEYCHSLGIYHRDLKPENILCFDGGLRVAITDFGLATTDKTSDEFRTGSVYHMSPECQSGEFSPGGSYSPMFNDIWSLGIILLNLATGRNPWKSACLNDPTFQAYLQDPLNFIPTVLPISDEANTLLTRMLEIDWRDRITIPEIRQALEGVPTFYSEGAIFDGSMARCPWEAGMDIESSSTKKEQSSIMVEESVAYTGTGSVKTHTPASGHAKKPFNQYSPVSPRGARAAEPKSHWSIDSTSDIVFANPSSMIDEVSSSAVEDEDDEWVGRPHAASEATWARVEDDEVMLYRPDSPDSILSRSPESPSFPVTPKTSDPYKFTTPLNLNVNGRRLPGLKIDTNCQNLGMRYYANNDPDHLDRSMTSPADSQVMHTALEYDPCSPGLFFPTSSPTKPLPSAIAESTLVSPTFLGTGMNIQMSEWDFDDSEPEPVPVLTRYSSASSFMKGISALTIERSAAPSPDTIVWPELRHGPLAPPANHLMSPIRASPLEAFPPRPLSPSQKLFEGIGRIVKPKPKKFFPSQPSSLPSSSSPLTSSSGPPHSKIPPPSPSSYTTDDHDHPLSSFTLSEMFTSPVKRKHGTAASSTHSHSPAWINIVSPRKHVRHHSAAHTHQPTSRRRNAFRRNHAHSTAAGVAPRRRSRSPRHWFLTTKLFASTGFAAT